MGLFTAGRSRSKRIVQLIGEMAYSREAVSRFGEKRAEREGSAAVHSSERVSLTSNVFSAM